MEQAAAHKPAKFLASVQGLFTEVERWATAKKLIVKRNTVTLNEEAYGVYQAETLQLFSNADGKIVELLPVGASIIGAKGRVDLVGAIDSAILVDWNKGGPSIETTIEHDGIQEKNIKPIYRDVGEAGWYWVESRKLSRAHKLDERLFQELLFAVSDYDCRS